MMGKTIYITNEHSKFLKKEILLEYGRNKTQKIIEEYIRRFSNGFITRYLDTKINNLPPIVRMAFGQATRTAMWIGVANRDGTLLDFLRINFYSQFGFAHNNNVFFAPGVARISLSELGFYSFDPSIMQGGKIVKLGNIIKIINKVPTLIENLELNEDFNGLGYNELMGILAEPVENFKKKIWNSLDANVEEGHRYNIIPLEDEINSMGQAIPNANTKNFLNRLSIYCDWCICGEWGDMEYAQYVSNGGKFYVCLRDDFQNVTKEVNEKTPLDDYGLSMIAVIVSPDGQVENITTRWNHENGGENPENLWLATHLQKVLGVRYKEIFKPRSANKLRQMNINESKVRSIYDQVKKVNSGILSNVSGIEEVTEPENSRYNIANSEGGYFHSINEVKRINDKNQKVPEKCSCGGSIELQIHGEPIWICHDCGKYYGTLPFPKPPINESIDSKSFNYKKAIHSIANFMHSEGLNVYPFPKVVLNWNDQDGLFIKTGYYEPDSKKVVLFCSNRHPKDILRSYAHEMIHHSQNLDGKDLSFGSNDDVKDNSRLEKIEGEAYLKGNIYFRKWTEYENSKKSSLNENIDYETVIAQAPDDNVEQNLNFGVNVNVDERDWLDLIFKGTKTIITCGKYTYNQWKKHKNEMIGIVRTTRHPKKDNPTGVLVGYARLVDVKEYSDYSFSTDFVNHRVPQNSEDAKDRCGLVLSDVHKLDSNIKLSREHKSVRPLNYPNNTIEEDMNPDDVDLTSFNIKHNLNPKFWKNERLDSRIRIKLLDIADDFIEFLGVDWVKPSDVIMTGSLANFNWDKKFSDIDLHIVMDFSKVDKRKDFVKNYFQSLKKIWNEEHSDLKIFGFPIEVYVQDVNEKHSSTGVYSLEKDKWITEPEREKMSKAKVNKTYIKKKVSEYIDKIDNLLTIYKEAKGDEHKINKISEDSDKLFDEIKEERSNGLSKCNNEISNGNIIFKCLRRMGYIEKLIQLKTKTYNKINSLP